MDENNAEWDDTANQGVELYKSEQLMQFSPDFNRLIHPFSMLICGPSQSVS